MRRHIIFLIVVHLAAFHCIAQLTRTRTYRYDKNSIVKDSTGAVVPFDVWNPLLASGKYIISRPAKADGDTSLRLVHLSKEELVRNVRRTRPPECPLLATGQSIEFEVTDINGKTYNSADLEGKIVVLHIWAISDVSKSVIGSMNELVDSFSQAKDVVFLSVCLDDERAVKRLIKDCSFEYIVSTDGRPFAESVGLKAYPANLVLDRTGKVYFHTCGMGTGTVYWLQKEIADLEKTQ
jgi:AhpC/TSA family protein